MRRLPDRDADLARLAGPAGGGARGAPAVAGVAPISSIAIVVPALDEAAALPRLARHLALLDPPPAEIVLADGGSADATRDIARAAGWRVVECARGRGRQINAGVAACAAPLVMVLHADTLPPDDALAVVTRILADPRVALAGFTPVIAGPETTRWITTAHNWAKTWYAPLLFRPRLFFRGGRLLFGDHAMFFRRTDFLAVGGCDEGLRVMEDADLCVRLCARGRVRLVNRVVVTSDRRVAAWGGARANWIYLKTALRWGVLGRRDLDYPDIR